MIVLGKQERPFFAVLYGPPKVGKTHLATLASKPLILDVEEGSHQFDVARIVAIKTKASFLAALREAYKEQDYSTIVIDSVTAVERLLVKHVLEEHKQPNLEAFGYGKGFTILASEWAYVLSIIESMREKKNIILIGHQKVKTVSDPTVDSYDKLEIDITKHATNLVCAASDAILFYRWKTRVKKDDNGRRPVAISQGVREVWTQERGGFLAGNRYGLDLCIENPTNESLWEKMK